MRVAQRLYENGHITYMRTDSTTLSESAIAAARGGGHPDLRRRERLRDPAPVRPQGQERAGGPRGDPPVRRRLPHPGRAGAGGQPGRARALRPDLEAHRRLADVRRARADRVRTPRCHRPATAATPSSPRPAPSSPTAASSRPTRRAATSPARATTTSAACPPCGRGRPHRGVARGDGHETQPPARFTEATLVKALEERGIGRPSTYAATISVILDRGYVFKKGTALVPTWLAFAVTKLLEQQFADLVDYDFTAQMESDLDRIADGEADRVAWLHAFYFGASDGPAGSSRRPQGARRQPRRHRRPRRSTASTSAAGSRCASAGTAPTSSAARSEPRCPRTSPRTS